MAKTGVLAVLMSLLLASCMVDRTGTRREDAGVDAGDAGDVDSGGVDSGGFDGGGVDSGGLDGGGDDGGLDAGVLTVVEVAVGGNTSCARRSDGDVFCWGENDRGQLGEGTSDGTSETPLRVGLPGPAAQITVGWGHACARLLSGDLYCWGNSEFGQVGDGTMLDPHPAPGLVSGGVRDVAAGGFHTCMVDDMGRVGCWGRNAAFQIGTTGGPLNVPNVVALGGTATATRVALGFRHTCALVTGGEVRCWGSDTSGTLGDGGSDVDRFTPMAVSGLGAASSMGMGELHGCAVVSGVAHCWGLGNSGRLGDMMSATSAVPSMVSTLTNVRDVRGGDEHTCAVLVDGSFYCWGRNDRGQLGIDNGDSDLNGPGEVVSLSGRAVTSFGLGASHTCVVTDGEAFCFGRNNVDQLSGPTGDSPDLVQVVGILP